ncbi:hypothetical protein LIER_10982 [Lithospermum erythrorhizon]|uniref:Uncharacterized protein n=1 Tax=Lithospermum erythrorhizon TaxID=34254 RepID=A0AAV3PQN8_LITER
MLDVPGLDGGGPVQVVADLADQPTVSVASGSGVPDLIPAAPVLAWGSSVGSPEVGVSSGDSALGREECICGFHQGSHAVDPERCVASLNLFKG